MVTFSQTESQLNLIQIEEVEKYVGIDFPNEYKNHLLKYNGGQCSPNVFKFNENGKWTESCVDWFLAIYDGEYDNLKEYIKTYKLDEKRLPLHMLPIAHDPGGNLICISCGTEDEGYIYFWDHENEVNYNVSSNADYSNLHFVAKDLNEFIDGLKEEFE
jgi:cell wall assembly regulator SMI1